MAPTDLFSSLAGGLGDEAYYLSQDPFFNAGRSVSGWQYQPTTNAEAMWMPALQGLLAGSLSGYGKEQARQQAFEDYSSNPLLAALAGETYKAESAPEDWTIRKGKNDLQTAILGQSLAYEDEKRKAAFRDDIQKLLIPKGALFTNSGEAVAIPGLAEIEAQAEAKKKSTAALADIKAQSDALGYNPKVAEETDKLRKEFSSLPEVKNFANVEKSAKIILEAIKDPSAVSDQELTRYSILLIEPGMAVREGEQAAIASSASIPEAWRGALSKSLSGGAALGEEVREGMKRLALRSYEGNKQQYDRTLDFYRKQAEKRGVNPSDISYAGESAPTEKIFGIPAGAVPTGKTSKGRPVYSVNGKLWVAD